MPKPNKYDGAGNLKAGHSVGPQERPKITGATGGRFHGKAGERHDLQRRSFPKVVGKVAFWFTMVVALLVSLWALTGCSVNVVVAPHATFAVESLNERNTDSQVLLNAE